MVLNIEQLSKIIREHQIKWCCVFDLSGNKIMYWSDKAKGEAGAKMTANDIVAKLAGFAQEYPGKYTVQLKTNPTDPATSIFTYTLHETGQSQPVLAGSRQTESYEVIEKRVRESIMKEIQADEEKKQLVSIKEEYQIKCRELDQVSGKVNYLLGQFFTSLMQKAPAGRLAGTESTVKENRFTSDEQTVINESLGKILTVMDVDTFKAVADKLHNEPQLVGVLKSFL